MMVMIKRRPARDKEDVQKPVVEAAAAHSRPGMLD